MSAIVVLLRRRCRQVAAGAVLVSGVAIPQTRADAAPASDVSIRVDYQAPAACPSRDEFLDGVRRYTAKWSLVDGEGASHELVVALDRPGAAWAGTLDIAVGPRKTRRVVSGPSCATVVRALAVMVALVIDPAASTSETTKGDTPPSPPETPPAPPLPDQDVQGPDVPPKRTKLRTESRSVAPVAPQKEADPRHASRSSLSLALRQEVTTAVVARPLLVTGAFVDYELPSLVNVEERTSPSIVVRPSVGLGLRQSLPTSIGVPGGSTDFLWSALTPRVCPLRLRLARERLELAPCFEASIGVLRATSQGIPLAQRTSKRWLDASATLLGVWQFAAPWFMTVSAGLVAPLARHRFEVVELDSIRASAPRTELVSQAPALGLAVGLGLGFRL